MLEMLASALFCMLVAGLVVKFALDRMSTTKEITWKEFAIVLAVFAIVVDPLVVGLGWNIAKQERLVHNEKWGGWELDYQVQEVTCTKDGPCKWEYSCDPYKCNPHKCNCSCTSRDSNGSCTSESCSTCYDTCYHNCPYCAKEYHYLVDTTLGSYYLAQYRLPVNPEANRWVSIWDATEWEYGRPVPSDIINAAGVGPTDLWLEAKARIVANNPGPVFAIKEYEDPLIASDSTTLKPFAVTVGQFKDTGLLPAPEYRLKSFYRVDLMRTVGFTLTNPSGWNLRYEKLNAAFGEELQADLRVIIVGDRYATENPDDYVLAVLSDWRNDEIYGDNTVSKNSLILILFTEDGEAISIARAATPMPFGNEYLLERMATRLQGQPLDPKMLFGDVNANVYTKTKEDGSTKLDVKIEHDQPGAVEDLLWGITEEETRFERVSMGDNFKYLWADVKPTVAQQRWIWMLSFMFGIVGWIAAAWIGDKYRSRQYGSRFYA